MKFCIKCGNERKGAKFCTGCGFKFSQNTTNLGTISTCPYCEVELSPLPKRKKKCEECGNYMYVRTRANDDRQKILIREDQIKKHKESWERYNGKREAKKLYQQDEYRRARQELFERFGQEPSLSDVKWLVCNQRLIQYSSERNWGLYRNTKLNMAEILKNDKRYGDAFRYILEVLYLDINGVQNVGHRSDKPIEYGFRPSDGRLPPGLIGMVVIEMERLDFEINNVHEIFLQVTSQRKPIENMPIDPERSWTKLEEEITERLTKDDQ